MKKININTATKEELEEIIHISPVRAEKIIAHRKKKRFRDVYELSEVLGLGEENMKDILYEGKAKVGYSK